MPMPRKIIDKMYWSGYCDEAITKTEQTDFALGGPERVSWMREHAPGCQDCLPAAKLQTLELRTVMRMGEAAVTAFHMGSSELLTMPGYMENLKVVLDEAIASGDLTQEDTEWMAGMAGRHGTSWPGHE
jgi:hypothetical protein